MAGFKFNPKYWGDSAAVSTHADESGQGEEQREAMTIATREISPVFDNSVPENVPYYKENWTYSWRISASKERKQIDLNSLSFMRQFVSKIQRSTKMFNTEIHLMWFSNIPQNLYREHMSFSLRFSQSTDNQRELMTVNKFPAYLNTHHIFFPGHSIELHGSPIPWIIDIDMDRIPISDNYVAGEIHIKLVGRQGSIPQSENARPSQIVALVTPEQPIAGVSLTRPRLPSSEWTKGYVKRGINSNARVEKMLGLQTMGIDVEAVALVGKLNTVLKKVDSGLLERCGDQDAKKEIIHTISGILSGGKGRTVTSTAGKGVKNSDHTSPSKAPL